MNTREKSCEDRIADEMASRFATMRSVLDLAEIDNDDATNEDDESVETLRESLLEWTPQISVRLLLSTGGPADGFDIVLDEEGAMVRGEYFYQDWFDGARRPLDEEELNMVEAIYGPFDHLRIALG